MKEEEKQNLTMADLQKAVDVLNAFSAMYRKAQAAIKTIGKEQGRLSGMMGRGGDPFTSMLFNSLQGMTEAKLEQMADVQAKKIAKRAGIETGEEEEEVTEELEEARDGLDAE
jgi:cytochrome c556